MKLYAVGTHLSQYYIKYINDQFAAKNVET